MFEGILSQAPLPLHKLLKFAARETDEIMRHFEDRQPGAEFLQILNRWVSDKNVDLAEILCRTLATKLAAKRKQMFMAVLEKIRKEEHSINEMGNDCSHDMNEEVGEPQNLAYLGTPLD